MVSRRSPPPRSGEDVPLGASVRAGGLRCTPSSHFRVDRWIGIVPARTELVRREARTAAPAALSLFLSPRKHRSEGICAGRARLTRSRGRRYVRSRSQAAEQIEAGNRAGLEP